METIVANLLLNGSPARRVSEGGRDWLVAPLAMIVDGVLHGSQGPGYYPPSETRRVVNKWDGMPITLAHPFDPKTGAGLSANDDGVLDRQGLGVVRRPVWNGKLRAEGWFDAEITKERASEVYNALLAGRPIELSTGLYTDNEKQRGTHNGKPYEWVARNHRPDHLAVLVGQKGACSVADGCGVHVTNADPQCPT